MTARALRIPDTGVRGVAVPDSVAVMHWPAADSPLGQEYVSLTGRMDLRFSGDMDFTIPGWRAFIAAAKAGEFDHLLEEEAPCKT